MEFNITSATEPEPHTVTTANGIAKANIIKAWLCYLCCDSCLHLGRAPIPDNRSTSPWSCTAHTPGCTLGGGCSSPPPHTSCCWSPGEAQGDKNTQPLSPVPRCTGDCSPLWLLDTDLERRKAKKEKEKKKQNKTLKPCTHWKADGDLKRTSEE